MAGLQPLPLWFSSCEVKYLLSTCALSSHVLCKHWVQATTEHTSRSPESKSLTSSSGCFLRCFGLRHSKVRKQVASQFSDKELMTCVSIEGWNRSQIAMRQVRQRLNRMYGTNGLLERRCLVGEEVVNSQTWPYIPNNSPGVGRGRN